MKHFIPFLCIEDIYCIIDLDDSQAIFIQKNIASLSAADRREVGPVFPPDPLI